MLNRATKIMNKQAEERTAMADKCHATIADAQKALKILGFEETTLEEIFEETKEQPTIIINKGRIVEITNDELVEELQLQLDIAKEELDYYHDVEKDYNNDIKLFKEENAKLIDENMALENEITFKDGQIIGYKRQIKELEDKVAELQSALNAKKLTKVKSMQDELKDYKEELDKEADAVETKSEQPKKKTRDMSFMKKLEQNKPQPFTLESALEKAVEVEEKKTEEKELAKAQFPNYTFEHETITFDKDMDARTNFGIRGTITFDDASYKFEATNNHHMPIVWGCMDEAVIRLTKDIIMHEVERFSFMNDMENNAANYSHINDAVNPLVVWRLTDENGRVKYHGYDKTRALTWEMKKFDNYVGRKMISNIFEDGKATGRALWKKLTNKQLSDKFMAICKELWPEDFTNDDNDPEPTKDKKQHQNTKEFFQITKEQHQQTKESNAVRFYAKDVLDKPERQGVDADGSDDWDI